MPTYEYACRRCGIVEAFQSMKDPALTKCPTCGAGGVQRIISGGAGVIFSGDGFWETDYNRSSDYKKKKKDETSSTPAPAPKPAPAAAPAPATKPATPTKPG
jgi:putative FmdB family regulatory protein